MRLIEAAATAAGWEWRPSIGAYVRRSADVSAMECLLSSKVGSQVTSYEYEPTGDLKKVTQPDGSWVAYGYDAARRLTGISDSAGNSIAYTLDNAGNRTKEEVKDPAGALARQISRVYDALGRVQQTTGKE